MDLQIPGERIREITLEEEMRHSYLDYSMSVIVSRALPDVRDGLKPVHRRVLYGMQELGVGASRAYKKSARIVGDVMGKYHPHGDSSIYDTLVRMAQDFSLRYPLVDGQGNFGSVDGDGAAAMRYTEARLEKIAEEMLADIDKETVDFGPNYDDTLQEPLVLPNKLPNLLVNGVGGIAVGMATNIPPHNLNEVVSALTFLVRNPDCGVDDIMRFITAPDFPSGGIVYGMDGVREGYRTGRGRAVIRARAHVEEGKGDQQSIIVTELPYQVNKANLIEKIAQLVNHKKIEGIRDLRDESDRDGTRMVIELKRDAVADIILNQLYKHTQLQTTFGINMIALDKGVPKLMNLRDLLVKFIAHRHEVVLRRTQFELRKAREREHILEGLKVAVDNIDKVIAIIRGSAGVEQARQRLRTELRPADIENLDAILREMGAEPSVKGEVDVIDSSFTGTVEGDHHLRKVGDTTIEIIDGVPHFLTEKQAQAILDMRLAKLTGLERQKLIDELAEVRAEIDRLNLLLESREARDDLIVEELEELTKKYGDDRRTEIVKNYEEFSVEDMIAEEDMVVTISHGGYIKRMPVSSYKRQNRGGRGRTGAKTKDEDFIEHLFVASTHEYLCIFTHRGHLHWLKVYDIPQLGPASRGKALVNLLELNGQSIRAVVNIKEFAEDKFLMLATRNGLVKKTSLDAYKNVRRGGITAINIREDDELIAADITDGACEVILGTSGGKAVRFKEDDVRGMGRTAAGVRGVNLPGGQHVVGMVVVRRAGNLLVATSKGYGKRSDILEYRLTKRGAGGVITLKTSPKVGEMIAIMEVLDDDDLMIMTQKGVLIRMNVSDVRVIGRATQGVRLIRLDEGDSIASIARVVKQEDEDAAAEGIDPNDLGMDDDEDAVDNAARAAAGEVEGSEEDATGGDDLGDDSGDDEEE